MKKANSGVKVTKVTKKSLPSGKTSKTTYISKNGSSMGKCRGGCN